MTTEEEAAMRSRLSRYWRRQLGVRRERRVIDLVNRITGKVIVANIGPRWTPDEPDEPTSPPQETA